MDKNVTSGNYSYRLKQIDTDGSYEYSKEIEVYITTPNEFSLEQNYPNPFNPTTKIKYTIPNSEKVLIKVYDVLGREAKTLLNEYKDGGTYEIEFDASNLTSGLYFYKIISGNKTETRKMMLVR
ncbi:MAG: T9SS type A sorting domain-containing protein [Bacteroidota bacterium]